MSKDKIDEKAEAMAEVEKVRDNLWNSRLKVQVLKEYFEEQACHSEPPDYRGHYMAWSEGVILILSEVMEAAEDANEILCTTIVETKGEVTA